MRRNMPSKREEMNVLAHEARLNSGNGHKKSVVIIPTYNEAGNLQRLVPSILRQGSFDILIIDDNSPDGTGELAEKLASRYAGRVSVLHRPGKLGLGSAYLTGFRYVLALGYQQIYTMDADFSHDPSALPILQAALEKADVVLGSRYVAGGGTLRWPLWRRLLSQGGSAYARLMLGLPMRDLTGGFKGFRREVLEALMPDLETIQAQGYAFQIEMTYRCARQGFRIVEVPICFEDRLVGKSKMTRGHRGRGAAGRVEPAPEPGVSATPQSRTAAHLAWGPTCVSSSDGPGQPHRHRGSGRDDSKIVRCSGAQGCCATGIPQPNAP